MKKKPPAIFFCSYCGKQFERKAYQAKKLTKHGRCCSMGCRAKYIAQFNPASKPDRVQRTCEHCGKMYEIQKYRINTSTCCSKSCAAKKGLSERWANGSVRTIVQCTYCDAEINIPKWDYEQKRKRGQAHFFCNRVCFSAWKAANWNEENNPSWKGGWTPHGTGWNSIRAIVRHEQNYCCEKCGIDEEALGKQLDIHHIIPARLFTNKKEASNRKNLVALCHSCHMKVEYE